MADGDGIRWKNISQSDFIVEFPPPSATVGVTLGACSRPGQTHAVNGDHYLVVRLGRHQEPLFSSLTDESAIPPFHEDAYGMVVADGMSVNGDSQSASALALETLYHLMRHFGKWNLRINAKIAEDVMQRAERFYRQVDSVLVRERSASSQILQTTLTATISAGSDLFCAHVGHSRAYLFRDGALMRLTRDHTIGRHNRTKTPLAPLVRVNPNSQDLEHVLTDMIGMPGASGPVIDLERIQLMNGDTVLVCSNGLTDMVDEEIIAELLASARTPDVMSQDLVGLAIAMGGDDDVTALVSRYDLSQKGTGG